MSEDDEKGVVAEERPISLNEAFTLGTRIEFLRRAGNHNYPIFDQENEQFILSGLENTKAQLDNTNVSRGIIPDIEYNINELSNKYSKEDDEESIVRIDDKDGRRIAESSDSWLRVIREELKRENRVTISNTGVVDYEHVMDTPKSLFEDETVWNSLPKSTQADIEESCRNLAFNCSTSAVFMALRAVEDRLQEWYTDKTGNSIADRTFGQVLGELDDQFNQNDRPPILSHLNYLKERRNQVAHPERSPSAQEAESTLIMVRETITDIHNKLN